MFAVRKARFEIGSATRSCRFAGHERGVRRLGPGAAYGASITPSRSAGLGAAAGAFISVKTAARIAVSAIG